MFKLEEETKKIKIGTRSSKLALAQANKMKDLVLEANPQISNSQIEIIKIKTSGDKIKDISLADIGGKGLFIKELEEQLAEGKIDVAVHSAKDVPPILHQNTDICAFSFREDVRDYFISQNCNSIEDLPQNSVVGTSSARRKSILLKTRPDLQVVTFRGNVDTRLEKLAKKQVDATILAVCGLKRIGHEIEYKRAINIEKMLPSVGQGCILVQAKKNSKTARVFAKINNVESEICVSAERNFLKILRASCRSPISVYCRIENSKLKFQSIIYDYEGREYYDVSLEQDVSKMMDLAQNYNKLLKMSLEMSIDAADKTRKNARELLERICR